MARRALQRCHCYVTGETQESGEITLSTGGARCAAAFATRRVNPLQVELFCTSVSAPFHPFFIQARSCSSNWTAAFSAIAPGDYKVFAWENLATARGEQRVLQKYEHKASWYGHRRSNDLGLPDRPDFRLMWKALTSPLRDECDERLDFAL
jgi:hypothetical protein